MKHILLSVILLASPLLAADDVRSFYREREFQIDSFYQTVTPDFEQERGSAGLGLNAFITRNLGFGVSTDLQNLNGPLIDNVSLRGIYRVPIDRTALYGYGGTTRYFKREDWSINLGVGAEVRLSPNAGPFVEAGMIKFLKQGAEATGRIGFRFSF